MALATNSTPGSVVLGGDLTGTAGAPSLRVTGVIPGSYTLANLVVDAKGRLVYAKEAPSQQVMDMLPPGSATTLGPIVACDQLMMVGNALTLNMNDATSVVAGITSFDGSIVNGVLTVSGLPNNTGDPPPTIRVGDGIIFFDRIDVNNVLAGYTAESNIEYQVTAVISNNQYQLNATVNFVLDSVVDPEHPHLYKGDILQHISHRGGKVRIGAGLEVEDGEVKLPYATIYSKGIMKPGVGLEVVGGVLTLGEMLPGEKGVVQIGANIDVTGGVISYSGIASDAGKGVVQVGSGLSVSSGVISLNAPTATTGVKGLVQVGTNIDVTGGTISTPTATDTIKGVIQPGDGIGVLYGVLSIADASYTTKGLMQVGSGLIVNAGVLSQAIASKTVKGVLSVGTNVDVASGIISVKTATTGQLGVVAIGANVDVSTGTISVATGTNAVKGLVQVGTNIDVTGGTISIKTATAGQLGVVQSGSGLQTTGGVLSLNAPDATLSSKGFVQIGSGLDIAAGTVSLNTPDATTTSKGIMQAGTRLTVTSGTLATDIADVIRLSIASLTTKAQRNSVIAMGGTASSKTWDGLAGNIFSTTLSTGTTLNNGTNLQAGTYYHFVLTNSQTITYGSQFKFKPNALKQPSGATGSKSVLSCYAVDTNTLYCIMQPNFV